MPERLFLFIQFEFPWVLGPPDGRYLLRSPRDGEPEKVVVLGTLAAGRVSSLRRPSARSPGRRGLVRARSGRARLKTTPEPAPVTTARATIVDPVSLSAERQAQAWLGDLDTDREAGAALAVLNRVLHSHRIASADPYVHEVSLAQALVIRAGWGEGEQVAEGEWLHARELPYSVARSRRRGIRDRSWVLRPQERLARLLGAADRSLLCEDLVLRARLDLDQGRVAHAAIELDGAFAAALTELRAEDRQDLVIRIAELDKLRAGVSLQARAALADPNAGADPGADPGSQGAEEEIVRHGLERLEATLRARTAPGFSVK